MSARLTLMRHFDISGPLTTLPSHPGFRYCLDENLGGQGGINGLSAAGNNNSLLLFHMLSL